MQTFETQPHILLRKEDVHPLVITVGDPARCEVIAKSCDSYKHLKTNREYASYEVTYRGTKILIISHGIGAAGAAVCFEELIALGVKCIIRCGTSGALNTSKFHQGDVVIVNAACAEDGASRRLVPAGWLPLQWEGWACWEADCRCSRR
eukprot:GHVT01093864.1.p1 GENE.GHVT01093864.1~~GHVT01093864.1.p1  ORF type:complete len:149 (+),score=6.38 GHVT01093864.1:161-607(+)